jgi:pyruvate/2-oxoglutarate dehydrogenase complex dihydrolipoamide dehydrogenase (E3) component
LELRTFSFGPEMPHKLIVIGGGYIGVEMAWIIMEANHGITGKVIHLP